MGKGIRFFRYSVFKIEGFFGGAKSKLVGRGGRARRFLGLRGG